MTDLKQTLTDIARAIVDNPDEVTVILTEDDRSITLSLNVAPEDMGMVIGKNGKIAKAIRSVIKAASRGFYYNNVTKTKGERNGQFNFELYPDATQKIS